MIAVFSPYDTARLRYVLNVLFSRWLSVDYTLYSDHQAFLSDSNACKLRYTSKAYDDDIPRIHNHGFLEHSEGRKCKVQIKGEGSDLRIFPGDDTCLGFDVFAGMFFCLSRYEEYDSSKLDRHGRFPAKESLAYRLDFLDRPIVDEWREALIGILTAHWKQSPFSQPKFLCRVTVDVDNASAYAYKGAVRSLLGVGRSLFRMDTTLLSRIKTLFNSANDPFLTYQAQCAIAKSFDVPIIHFVLCAGLSPHDRSLNPSNPHFKGMLSKLNKQSQVAWHPSYSAFGNPAMLDKELQQLNQILGSPVTQSRQHYIRLQFPETYRHLISLGIKDDYSMGYPDHDGFRAGTTLSFPFFDIDDNRESDLIIHPFYFLDTYYSEVRQLSAEAALPKMKAIADTVKQHGGELNLVWHNRTFSELRKQWKGWTKALVLLLTHAQKETV